MLLHFYANLRGGGGTSSERMSNSEGRTIKSTWKDKSGGEEHSESGGRQLTTLLIGSVSIHRSINRQTFIFILIDQSL